MRQFDAAGLHAARQVLFEKPNTTSVTHSAPPVHAIVALHCAVQ